MHELLIALSLAALTFMPCIVSADAADYEFDEVAA